MSNTVYRADERELVRAYYGTISAVSVEETRPVSEKAEIVEIFKREVNSYGDYNQGDGEISVIFKVGDRYFRQYGYLGSYGGDDPSFGGRVEEVYPEEKTVYTFRSKA